MKKVILISLAIVTLLGACIGNTSQNDKAKNTNKSPLEQYLSYTKDSVFNGTQYLSDNSGHWVCYKYEKVKKDENIINTRPTDNRFDKGFAYEFKKYFNF